MQCYAKFIILPDCTGEKTIKIAKAQTDKCVLENS